MAGYSDLLLDVPPAALWVRIDADEAAGAAFDDLSWHSSETKPIPYSLTASLSTLSAVKNIWRLRASSSYNGQRLVAGGH